MNKPVVFCLFALLAGSLSASVNFNVQDPNTLSFNAGTSNEVRRFANIRLNKTKTHYTLSVDAGVRDKTARNVIKNNDLADIDLAVKAVRKTVAEVKKAKKIEVDFILSALPNPLVKNGYEVFLQAQSPQFNLLAESKDFFKFQTNASSNDQTALLYFTFLLSDNKTEARTWFTIFNSTLLTTDWKSDRLFVVNNSFGSTKKRSRTFKVRMEYDFLKNLPTGTFIFRIMMGMNPYQKPTLDQEITKFDQITEEQTAFFDNLIADIQGKLKNQNSVYVLTTAQLNQLKTNRTKIFQSYKTFLDDVLKQYQALQKRSGLTPVEVADIDAHIVIINAKIKALNKLIAASK